MADSKHPAVPDSNAGDMVREVAKDLPKGDGAPKQQGTAADALPKGQPIEKAPGAATTVAGDKLAHEK